MFTVRQKIHSILRSSSLMLLVITMGGCSQLKPSCAQKKGVCTMTDPLASADKYIGKHPAFAEAFAFLRQPNLTKLAPGRHEIDGDKLFCIIEKKAARSREDANLEAHRKYIDIQYVIQGDEEMGWRRTATCTQIDQAYDADKDIGFFQDAPECWVPVAPGHFIVFFPGDAHAPLVGKGEIHKAVIKIKLDQ